MTPNTFFKIVYSNMPLQHNLGDAGISPSSQEQGLGEAGREDPAPSTRTWERQGEDPAPRNKDWERQGAKTQPPETRRAKRLDWTVQGVIRTMLWE